MSCLAVLSTGGIFIYQQIPLNVSSAVGFNSSSKIAIGQAAYGDEKGCGSVRNYKTTLQDIYSDFQFLLVSELTCNY